MLSAAGGGNKGCAGGGNKRCYQLQVVAIKGAIGCWW